MTGRIQTFYSALRSRLEARRLPIGLACVSMVLVLPSILIGLQFDDFYHRDILLHRRAPPAQDVSFTGMFSFLDGDAQRTRSLMEADDLPWWTNEETRLKFMRPASELTHLLDYRLWPGSPGLMHLHSILWFGLMVGLAAWVYREVMGPSWVAGLAGVLFALDEAHGVTAGWIAHRNATLAAVFGLLCLLAHHRWRRHRWRLGSVLSPICLGLGLLGSEGAVAAGAYLLAYQLFLDEGGLGRKVLGLMPCAAVGVAWFLIHRMLGFGTWGSGVYLDPMQEPGAFAMALMERAPLLLFCQWFNVDPLLYHMLDGPGRLVMYALAVTCVLAALAVMCPLIRRDPIARFWILGALLCLVPIGATFASNRLLIFVGLGGMGLVAQVVARSLDDPTAGSDRTPAFWLTRVFALLMLALHLALTPIYLPFSSVQSKMISWWYQEKPMRDLLREVDTSGKTVVLLNPSSPVGLGHVADYFGEFEDLNMPEHILILSATRTSEVEVTRTDERALEIASEDGLLSAELSQLLRSPSQPIPIGTRVVLPRMVAEVLAQAPDGLPSRVRFTFPVSLDDPSLVFTAWTFPGYAPVDPPPIGRTVRLAPESTPPPTTPARTEESPRV